MIKVALLKIYREQLFFKKIFTASEDGWHIKDFHSASDN